MSNYTSILLFISPLENEKVRMEEVNLFDIRPGIKISLADLNDTNKYPDMFPRFTYGGTYKSFDLQNFLNYLQRIKWDYPEYVQLLIREEKDITCKFYSMAGKVLEVDSQKY